MESGRHSKKPPQRQKDSQIIIDKEMLSYLYLDDKKLPKKLYEDLERLNLRSGTYGKLYQQLSSLLLNGQKQNLIKSAKISHEIIDNLLYEQVPDLFVEAYVKILLKNRSKISKFLDQKGADGVFKFVPTWLLIDYLDLFNLDLTAKQSQNITNEIVNYKYTVHENLWKLADILKKSNKEIPHIIISKLVKMRKYDAAAKIIKKLHIDQKQYPQIQNHFLFIAAKYIPKEKKGEKGSYSWQILEEVFCQFPIVLAKVIETSRRLTSSMLEQFAAICSRHPKVLKHLSNKHRRDIEEFTKSPLKNKLQSNHFSPSDKSLYFSLEDFQISQKNVIWIDHSNIQLLLDFFEHQKIIGIDTQSTVARTTFDNAKNLLSTIQIAGSKQILIVDAFLFKEKKVSDPIISGFLADPSKTIVGHTLKDDLKALDHVFTFKGQIKCKLIEIQPLFQKIYPKKRSGLASISEDILGRKICKEYTLTNWDRRPLLKNQLHYAAMDAFILLEIWKKMELLPVSGKQKNK